MKEKLSLALTGGFALFSMFFGSGNLVFPLSTGAFALNHFAYAAAGLLITGVVVPFLGVMSLVCAEGSRRLFFGKIGRLPAFWLTFLMLAIMGPFGVSARCILVAFGGMKLVIPGLSEVLFAAFFCLLTGVLCWQKTPLVAVIGRYLTPLLLLCIFCIIGFGLWGVGPLSSSQVRPEVALREGLGQGYQTMDLLAAFFFSAATIQFLKTQVLLYKSAMNPLRLSLYASLFGMMLLGLVYGGFVYLGAAYAPYLSTVAPEQMLTMIAGVTLGAYALPLMSLTIALACLTTLIILTTLFADFLREDVSDGKISRSVSLILTLGISFGVSLAGFTRLAGWIGMVLMYAYPALIALALGQIVETLFGLERFKVTSRCFYVTLGGLGVLSIGRLLS